MGLTKRNLKRLASLSAIGAGAVAVTADKAEASIIYSGPLNNSVGFTSGNSSTTITGSASSLIFRRASFVTSSGSTFQRTRSIRAYGYGASLARAGSTLRIFPAGATWAANPAGNSLLVGGRRWGASSSSSSTFAKAFGNAPFTDQFALFRFQPSGSPVLYGWVELSYAVTAAFGSNAAFGPELTVQGWGFDNSGARIAAGQTGPSVPEPATFAMTGLAALVLGAIGARRWRTAKQG